MTLSTNLVSGLSSGIDWRTMIDQLIAVNHKSVDLVEDQKTEYEDKLEIFQDINSRLLSFKTQAATLASSDAFNVFTSSLSTNSTTYDASDFLSVTTSTTAGPGTHTITMNSNSSVAEARQISSKSFTSYDTDLDLAGEFIINGRAVNVEDGDDLQDIRDKINNLNSGTDATGITASILTVSSDNYRMILTSDDTGEDAFSILDASSEAVNILQNVSTGLGFIDSTTPTIKNSTSDGGESDRFSSSDAAIGSLLGITNAQTGTNITVGTTSTLDIDLSTDSLTTIASNINALSGVSASVESVTEDGITEYYIDISGTTNFGDKNNVLQTLGILVGGQSDVAEVHLSDTANTKVAGGNIDATTTWEQIDTTGSPSNNIVNDDTILIKGTKHDGTTVDTSFTISDKTLAINDASNNFLEDIETAFSLDAGSVTIVNGKIQVTDSTGGDSQLSILLVSNNEGGGTLNLGTLTASTEGYTMEVQAGQDANIIVDGTAVTSDTNIIDDVIAGVKLNLKTIEQDKTVTITIGRDYDTIKSSVQGLLDTYNDVLTIINEQFAYDEETETAGLLQGDATLSSIKSNLTDIVTSSITGVSTTLNALSLIGINSTIDYSDHSNDGMLKIDNDVFMDAMQTYFNDFMRVFIAEGSTTDGDVEYVSHSRDTVAGDYEVNITQAATQASETGSIDLSGGIGDYETITISQGGRVAAVTLDSSDNGSSIDNIVNAINSEFDTEYTQTLMGNVKNTTDAAETTAITSSTKWNSIYSGGVSAGLANNDVITFTGNRKNGTDVSGSYTISNVASDTVQGLLSAIESAYDNEVTAAINSYGYLVVTDKNTGSSELDITITEPAAKSLDFGEITTSNLVGSVRNTTDGTNAIISTTKLDATGINGSTVVTNDVFKFSGYTVDGSAVEGSFTVDTADTNFDDVGDLLGVIKTAYDAAGGDVTASIQDGRIMIKDGTTNSTLGIEIFEPSGKGVDFGTFGGGVSGRYAVDVTASKDGSNQLVLTGDDYGSSASFTVSQSRASTDTNYQQIIYTNTSNTTDVSNGDIYISSSTAWTDIYGAGTIETGDTITLSGTDRGGAALNPTGVSLIYTIDVSTDTVDTLLTRIENVFADANNTTPTTVDARIEDGKIIVEDQTSGSSSISLTLAYNDVGGSATGTLDLGTIDQSTERDLDLGMANGTHSGLDVQGTINSESATGSGQILTGDAPGSGETTSVEDLAIKYTGTGTGAQGNVEITMGVAELFDRSLFNITDQYLGYLAFKIDSTEDNIDSLETSIEEMEARLDLKTELMINQFVAMELALSKIQSMSNWLTGQVQAANKGWV